MEAILSSTTIRTALIDYRAEQLRLLNAYPATYQATAPAVIASIDAALLAIEGNITSVRLVANTCTA